MSGSLRIGILGPLNVATHDGAIHIGSYRERALLSKLALNPGVEVTMETLIDVVWPSTPPRTARAQIATCVSHLRRTLANGGIDGHSVIETGFQGYRLGVKEDGTDAVVDVALFGKALDAAKNAARTDPAAAVSLYREAIGLWRGNPLIEFESLRADMLRLREDRLGALHACLDIELRIGRHRQVVGELQAIVADEPTQEQFRAQLMLSLYRCGNRAAALQAYREGRRVLLDENGIEPGLEIFRMHQMILEDNVTVQPPGSRSPQRNRVEPRQLPFGTKHFVGRTALISALDESLLREGEDSGPPRTLLSGQTGVGKTALALRWAHLRKDRHPDGQFYADLGERGCDPHTHLHRFLRSLDVAADSIPRSLGERAAEFRSRTADRRLLVVLDDARKAEHVLPLLPASPSCQVIVTGSIALRELVSHGDFDHLAITALVESDCRELLGKLGLPSCDATTEDIADLIQLSGGRPRELRNLVSHAQETGTLSVRQLLREARTQNLEPPQGLVTVA